MKKLLTLIGCGAIAALFATGCTTVNTNDAASDSKVAMVPAVYEPLIKHEAVKVEGKATIHVLFNFFKWGDSKYADRTALGTDSKPSLFSFIPNAVRDVKAAAVYNACKAKNCDLLLSAKYEVTATDYFVYKVLNCTVKGFPGNEVGVVKKDVTLTKDFNTVYQVQ